MSSNPGKTIAKLRRKVSSETSSTTIETIEMTRSEALDLAMALIEAAKP